MKHCVTAALFVLLVLPTAAHAWTAPQQANQLVYRANGDKFIRLAFNPPLRAGQQVYRLYSPKKPGLIKRWFAQGKRFGLVERQYAPVPKGGR